MAAGKGDPVDPVGATVTPSAAASDDDTQRADSAPVSPAGPTLATGAAIGRYLVLDVLGRGGMGVVYSVYDPMLDRKIAVKQLLARESADGTARLHREAQALAKLSHPNVVAVHDVSEQAGSLYIAMELVDGGTLREWQRGKPWRDIVTAYVAAGRGLAAAHEAGLVHRDFKPENVLVSKDGRVRVTDFGLARSEQATSLAGATPKVTSKLTEHGAFVGTPRYMAPEQLVGGIANARSDQFSWCLALWEALFGDQPFAINDMSQRIEEMRAGKLEPPAAPKLPRSVVRTLQKGLANEPRERWASIEEAIDALHVATVRRNRVALAISAAVVAGGLATTFVVGRQTAGSGNEVSCDFRTRAWLVWNPATKTALRASFAGTGLSDADTAAHIAIHSVDDYIDRWLAAMAANCRATRERGEQSEETMRLRAECLDNRLARVRAHVDVWTRANSEVVGNTMTALWDLTPLETCDDLQTLRLYANTAASDQAAVDALGNEISSIEAGIAFAHEDATARIEKALKEAERLGARMAYADVLYLRAHLLMNQGRLDEAARVYRDGLDDAIVHGVMSAIAPNALALSWNALRDGKTEVAETYLDIATAAGRTYSTQYLELERLRVEGVLAAARGDLSRATKAHEKAFALTIERVGRDTPAARASEADLAATMARSGMWAAAIPHLEHVLAGGAGVGGTDAMNSNVQLSNLGAAYSHVGRHAEARATLEKAVALREKTFGADSPMMLAPLDNLADMLRRHGDLGEALAVVERARAIANRAPPGNPFTHAVHTTYAQVLTASGRAAEARAVLDPLITLEERTKSFVLADTLAARGDIAMFEQHFEQAAGFYQRAVDEWHRKGGEEDGDSWIGLVGLARAKIALGKTAEARPLLEHGLAIATKQQIAADQLAPAREALATIDRKPQ